MIRAGSFPGPLVAAAVLLPLAVAGNLLLALELSREALIPTVAVAFLPAALLLFGTLTAAHRHVLVFAALALNMSAEPLNRPFLGSLYVADILVALAFGSWLASGLLDVRTGRRPRWPDTPVLGWPLALFAAAIMWATVRGHEAYASPLFGSPLRFIAYAAIAGAVVGANPHRIYRGVVAIFYVGTVWMFVNALYYLATGTSQTQNFTLSTGGTRVVSGTVSLYLALAFFLALINLQVDRSIARRLVHVAIASLAAFGIVLAYGRAVYVAVAIMLPIVLIGVWRIHGALASVVPFVLPFVVAGIIFVPHAVPEVVPTFLDRITAPASEDINVRFRQTANAASLDLARDSPAIGVGFGREITFRLEGKRYQLHQGSHNSFLWMLSGGGALALGAFALLFAGFVLDALRRMRRAVDLRERALITWSLVALAVILIAAAAGPVLSAPSTLITIWTLLLLPTVVPHRPSATGPSAGSVRLAEGH